MDKFDIAGRVKELNEASKAYYNTGQSIMSDYEFDKKLEELKQLEEKTGIVMSNSPTHNVGYSVADELNEVEHNHPMLSLDKTKSVDELIEFIGDNDCFLSVKADGLTTSLNYIDGKLIGAETRGDGVKRLDDLREYADEENIPYDGAVMAIDNYKIAESMGRTEKFFKHSMAYKYEDELFETLLTDIEWNTSKTGLINPVAIFEPVNLNGAITTRATLHNITYIKDMMLGIGDRIRVYRSNMVIPKIHDSIDKSGNFSIPDKCPICGQPTRIVKENDSEVLMCENPNCKGKLLNKLVHAASRNALDIENLSESTIEKFINLGWLNSIKDIYHLSYHENDMKTLEGFGKKSVEKLLNSIEESRKTSLERFLYSLSVPLLGKSASKMIAEAVDYDLGKFMNIMTIYGAKYFGSIQGIGNVLISSMDNYFEKQCDKIWQLSKEFVFETKGNYKTNDLLNGKTFVITGSLNHYSNRNELKEVIESNGGKVSGSISSKTSYLINNDIDSTSSKNKKAKSLGIPIINEEDFANMLKK